MKKILSILLTVCICISVGVILTSCEHDHSYQTEWSKDATHHWHACEDESCNEVSDKAKHTWGDREKTDVEGVSKLTCTVCGYSITENVQSKDEENDDGRDSQSKDTVTKDEWNNMIAESNFDNITFAYNATFISGYNDEGPHTGLFKLDGNKLDMDGEVTTDTETITSLRSWYIASALAIVNNFDKFEYDEANDCYKAKEKVVYNVTVMEYEATITAENVLVELDDNMNIAKITCKMTQAFKEDNVDKTYVLNVDFTFSEYGTTVVGN